MERDRVLTQCGMLASSAKRKSEQTRIGSQGLDTTPVRPSTESITGSASQPVGRVGPVAEDEKRKREKKRRRGRPTNDLRIDMSPEELAKAVLSGKGLEAAEKAS